MDLTTVREANEDTRKHPFPVFLLDSLHPFRPFILVFFQWILQRSAWIESWSTLTCYLQLHSDTGPHIPIQQEALSTSMRRSLPVVVFLFFTCLSSHTKTEPYKYKTPILLIVVFSELKQ